MANEIGWPSNCGTGLLHDLISTSEEKESQKSKRRNAASLHSWFIPTETGSRAPQGTCAISTRVQKICCFLR